jgi:N-hydroxyarylamine O-acetyltransferase
MLNLDAYFERIAYAGPRRADLQTLHALHLAHTQSIPFENLSPFFGMEVRLDVPSLLDKFARQRRGGYCYEHNLLFQHVLHALGFCARGLAARVRWNVPEDRLTPRSHMLLLVEIGGAQYIADTGFGGLTLTAPLRLETGIEQDTPHGPFRLLRDERKGEGKDRAEYDAYRLEACLGGEWKILYVFDLQPQVLPDYEVSSWYLSHHPQSIFTTGLLAALPAIDGRHALRNNIYTFHGRDGRQEKKMLETVDELKDVFERIFRIRMPDLPDADRRLEKLLRADDGLA